MKPGEQRKPNMLLREQRLLRGWSLQRVVEELCALSSADNRLPGVNAPMVSNWETGTKKPSPFYRERLCKLYNMAADQLGFMDAAISPRPGLPIRVAPGTTASSEPSYRQPIEPRQSSDIPKPVQTADVVPREQIKAVDLLSESAEHTLDEQMSAWLVLSAQNLTPLFDAGWTPHMALEALHVLLPEVHALSQISRRTFGHHLLQLGATAFLSGIPIPTGKHISAEDLTKLHSTLGDTIAATWKLFQNAGTAQVLTIAQAQLTLIEQVHALLYPSVRPFLYTGVYSLIGIALHFQARDEEALRVQHSAYIAALATGDPWYVAQSLICQADSHHALGQYDTAIQMIEEALRIIGKPTDSALVCARAHLLTCWADNAMMLEDYTTAEEKLDISSEYLDQIVPNEEFDRDGWLLLAGKYALKTGDYQTAVQHFKGALAELPEHWIVRRTMTAIGLAMAYARMNERDNSLAVAKKLMPWLKTINAPMTIRWFIEYLQQDLLGMFPTEREVYTFVADTYRELPQLIGAASYRK